MGALFPPPACASVTQAGPGQGEIASPCSWVDQGSGDPQCGAPPMWADTRLDSWEWGLLSSTPLQGELPSPVPLKLGRPRLGESQDGLGRYEVFPVAKHLAWGASTGRGALSPCGGRLGSLI